VVEVEVDSDDGGPVTVPATAAVDMEPVSVVLTARCWLLLLTDKDAGPPPTALETNPADAMRLHSAVTRSMSSELGAGPPPPLPRRWVIAPPRNGGTFATETPLASPARLERTTFHS
jgi:hypothetical protein